MKNLLPALPFPHNALEPVISAETMAYHHGKHQKAYVEKLGALIQGTEFENLSLEEIMTNSSGPIFNNAAQVWNHTFFWHCLTPQSRDPQGPLKDAVDQAFGSIAEFHKKFEAAAAGLFGSGWAWLVRNDKDGTVSIETTSNAENPVRASTTPLLTVDVWEHAYYIDYRHQRAKYLSGLWSILNWEFAEKNFESAWSAAA